LVVRLAKAVETLLLATPVLGRRTRRLRLHGAV
jgi:hypothetical protein